jgi:hypothetical protein
MLDIEVSSERENIKNIKEAAKVPATIMSTISLNF